MSSRRRHNSYKYDTLADTNLSTKVLYSRSVVPKHRKMHREEPLIDLIHKRRLEVIKNGAKRKGQNKSTREHHHSIHFYGFLKPYLAKVAGRIASAISDNNVR